MNQQDFSNYTEMLLHCVHGDNNTGPDNALLMYCGLRILGRASDENISPQDFNAACWALRDRIAKPPVRLIKADPINIPGSQVPGILSVLALPNTTTLNSSSSLLKQAQSRFSSKPQSSKSKLGSVVHSEVAVNRYYDDLWHLVCRNPGDPSTHMLSRCFEELTPCGPPTFLHLPIFGKAEEAEQWVNGIAVWLTCRENIQHAGIFMDIYFIDESEEMARRISDLLNKVGIRHDWVSEENS